uniref:Uncharacterized protein n=1 Tax=Parascaris equorum TaxID=6256 RepID=A0A914SDC8_PAREQ
MVISAHKLIAIEMETPTRINFRPQSLNEIVF